MQWLQSWQFSFPSCLCYMMFTIWNPILSLRSASRCLLKAKELSAVKSIKLIYTKCYTWIINSVWFALKGHCSDVCPRIWLRSRLKTNNTWHNLLLLFVIHCYCHTCSFWLHIPMKVFKSQWRFSRHFMGRTGRYISCWFRYQYDNFPLGSLSVLLHKFV